MAISRQETRGNYTAEVIFFFHNVESYGSAIRTYGCGDTSLSSLAGFTVRVGTEEAENCAPQKRGKRQGATELK